MSNTMSTSREVLFEFQQVGSVIKVTAIDPDTGIEATIQGPATASQHILQQNAIQKLNYLLKKNAQRKEE